MFLELLQLVVTSLEEGSLALATPLALALALNQPQPQP
jgi:hypothetical protein